ncbi:hypothetical protein ONS95_000395 [Cadophora gregata]|uniref:uncharacterized protein n=1 Tax=Cadophora gregata TaxID=51156 RepID=UPI0026DCC385|nr:uncharacterized protein ONS95_000395 [Cadophora gregata]KAK0125597.1 hypothetical protein ONS96_009432 [Cadophora gregata f. sp. sojae]KAK0128422.1 hypothetical protein ONS95_000395 [Cadophora gregata]
MNSEDSTFYNVVCTLAQLEIARKPKVRGARTAALTEAQALTNLSDDIKSMVKGSLSQKEKLEAVPDLDAVQVEALRALHTVMQKGKSTEAELKCAVEAAIKALNPDYEGEEQEEENNEELDEAVATTDRLLRRSQRVAEQQKKAIKEYGPEEEAEYEGIFKGEDEEDVDEDEEDADEDEEDVDEDEEDADEDEDVVGYAQGNGGNA